MSAGKKVAIAVAVGALMLLLAVPMGIIILIPIIAGGDASQACLGGTGGDVVSTGTQSLPPLSTVLPSVVGEYRGVQIVNAAQIVRVGQARHLDAHTITMGVAAAMDESSLTNVSHGDAVRNDTVGLFQEGPERGPLAQRMDPAGSAQIFFDYLLRVPGYEQMEPTLAIHKAQQNADPYTYAKFWTPATQMVAALTNSTTASASASTSTSTDQTDPQDDQFGTSDADADPSTGPVMGAGAGEHYATAGMRPQTVQVANLIGHMFKIRTVGGYRPMSSPYDDPVYGHSSGLAIDFMIDDIPNGTATGYALASYVQAHTAQLGVRYIIYHQHIWAPYHAAEGWRLMADRGDPTQNHLDHVHVSLDGSGSTDLSSLGGASASPDVLMMANAVCPGAQTSPGTDAPNGTVGQVGTVTQSGWAMPAKGPLTSPFGMRTNPVTGIYKLHSGIDIGAPCQAPIYAANTGTVTQAGPMSGYGNLMTVDHGNGTVTRYAHMFNDGVLVHTGQHVTAGEQIGKVGTVGNSTGCHLHFEVLQDGKFVDPQVFLAEVGIKVS